MERTDVRGQHRDSTASQIPHFSHEPSWLNHAVSLNHVASKWARLDSKQGPTDYESAALTS